MNKFFLTLFLLLMPCGSFAQDKPVTFDANAYIEPYNDDVLRLSWRTGLYNFDDTAYIDHHIMMQECQIYEDYHEDEFEWSQIRKVIGNVVRDERENYPLKFFFRIPLPVKSYDFKEGNFPLYETSQLIEASRLLFELPAQPPKCTYMNEDDLFVGVETRFSVPLTIRAIQADKKKADEIVKHFVATNNRTLFGKVFVTFTNPYMMKRERGYIPVLYGTIDRIEYYVDGTLSDLISIYEP